jgi:hypothetical protein
MVMAHASEKMKPLQVFQELELPVDSVRAHILPWRPQGALSQQSPLASV